ncbi:MAG: HAD family hydrolase [Actinobacteria bacterium]|nr:HAD family hydrolase [Actinomycetota bacterium]
MPLPQAVILDLDGTLVDSVYLHVQAWAAAFREAGRPQPAWRVHSAIGLPGERLVRWLLAEVPTGGLIEELVESHRRRFLDAAGQLQPTTGASALLEDLRDRGVPFVVATSASKPEREALLAVLGDPEVAVTGAGDAGGKPDAGPVAAAAADLPSDASVRMLGDATWDGHAAAAAGVEFVAVRTGGFSDAALHAAGARMVFDAPAAYVGVL